MFLGKVVGTVWSTKKSPDLEGVRFLIVHPYDLDKQPNKSIVVVADRLGAGPGETVMCAFGKAARTAIGSWTLVWMVTMWDMRTAPPLGTSGIASVPGGSGRFTSSKAGKRLVGIGQRKCGRVKRGVTKRKGTRPALTGQVP